MPNVLFFMRISVILIAILLALAADAEGQADGAREDPAYDGPLIDNHVHVFPAGTDDQAAFIEDLISAMDRGGVTKVVLGLNAKGSKYKDFGPTFDPIHDRWVEVAFKRHPERFYPTLGGFDPESEDSVGYVTSRLESGFWKEVGELDLRNRPKRQRIPADSPVLMRILQAGSRRTRAGVDPLRI